jgi:hypothetical protein
MKKYSKNLIDRMGGIWMILVVGVIGLVLGMVIELLK